MDIQALTAAKFKECVLPPNHPSQADKWFIKPRYYDKKYLMYVINAYYYADTKTWIFSATFRRRTKKYEFDVQLHPRETMTVAEVTSFFAEVAVQMSCVFASHEEAR